MGRKSKAKGYGFEHKMEQVFSDMTGVQWVRTPMSGGWGRCKTKGDLIPPENTPYSKLFIECKKVEKWDLWTAVFNDKGPLRGWWEKAKQQADEEDKVPVVVFAQNNKPPLALFDVQTVNATYVDVPTCEFLLGQDTVFIIPVISFIEVIMKQAKHREEK